MDKFRSFSVALPHLDLEAVVRLEAADQLPSSCGDRVVVTGKLFLPYVPGRKLRPELQFGRRVSVFGQGLHGDWGYDDHTASYRHWPFRCAGWTWESAFARAEQCARGQLAYLIAALEARYISLLLADEPEDDGGACQPCVHYWEGV